MSSEGQNHLRIKFHKFGFLSQSICHNLSQSSRHEASGRPSAEKHSRIDTTQEEHRHIVHEKM